MEKEICVLFDMDGVVLDTETQYDKFWKHIGERYNVGIPNFEKQIKGTTLPNIINKYFSELSQQERDSIVSAIHQMELEMSYDQIPGALKFIHELKNNGIKYGLVTSSMQTKMDRVNKVQHFDQLFPTIITGDLVKEGKPNPQCYLLGAAALGVDPKNCIVFEDSLAGIQAGKSAGMKVIALSTTHPLEMLQDKVDTIIPNFVKFSLQDLKNLQ